MSFLRPVNLPAPVILQCVSSVGLGLYIAFFRKPPFTHKSYSVLIPSNASARTADSFSFLGLLIAGLNSYFLVASYMPIEENQIIAASIPVRLGLVCAIAGISVLHRKTMSKSGFWELICLSIVDGGSAIALGVQLGTWDGIVQGAVL
jgi:hypothetical protein